MLAIRKRPVKMTATEKTSISARLHILNKGKVPAITLFWAETTLQAPSYPPGPVSLAPSGLWGCPGGAALQTRAYLALMVLLEVTLRVFGFSSFYLIMGRNPGWCLRGEQEPQRVTGSTRK